MAAFDRGELRRDFVAVVRWQGPRANGMPELHKLTPPLGVLQDDGFKVALVTDGRMSGASGKVPAAIHVTPECVAGGSAGEDPHRRHHSRRRPGRHPRRACVARTNLPRRPADAVDLTPSSFGLGRELFATFRANAASAEQGAMTWLPGRRPARRRRRDVERRARPRPLRLRAGGHAMTILELMRHRSGRPGHRHRGRRRCRAARPRAGRRAACASWR